MRSWCYGWGRICVCCLGCAVRKSIRVRCVLYILRVPDISVLDCGLFVQYMIFGACYT